MTNIKQNDWIEYKITKTSTDPDKVAYYYYDPFGSFAPCPNYTIKSSENLAFWAKSDGMSLGFTITALSVSSRLDLQILVNHVVVRSDYIDSQHTSASLQILGMY